VSAEDEAFMRRALALALDGLGRVAPNPSVGCVLVRDGVVMGEGRTGDGGRPHAEEAALAQAGAGARGSTAYVTLEPCARRTSGAPSCSALLAQAGVKRAVVATVDPHPNAAGAGLAALETAGAAVEVGLLAGEAEALNAGFFSLVRTGRALVVTERADAGLTLEGGETLETALLRAGKSGLTRVTLSRSSTDARSGGIGRFD
jgi:diaminohydroxyphosphoribosylaminopyrimidine deaminase / 5-amino-6-(5-phosphoribosylamino)uracil reductase